uniref:Putative secreted protein n=1 Tax=Anopheles darlingi TaxID=43151 RepID=A0A2M4D980_ANODA
MLEVRLASLPSVCTVVSALRSGSPSSSHTIFAAGKEPQASHLIGTGRPAVSSSFADTIFTRSGFRCT